MLVLVAVLCLTLFFPVLASAEEGDEWPPTKEYVVQPGDTYLSIAQAFYGPENLDRWRDLQAVNGWEPTAIPVGATMKIPFPWRVVSGAFGGEWGGEIGDTLKLLQGPVTYISHFGRELWCAPLDGVPTCVTALGVEQGNAMQMTQEIYTMFSTQPWDHVHGGINGGFYEVGSSVVPKQVCVVDKFYNYPVLAPQPYWTEERDTLRSLAERYGWTQAEVDLLIARNPGKLTDDYDAPIRPGTQLVGPKDEAWNDHFISRGVTVYTRDGQSERLNCFEVPDELYGIAVDAIEQRMETIFPPAEIVDWVKASGRDPTGVGKIHYGEDQVLCAGGSFYASPLEAWRLEAVFGCNGVDMETPFVAWAVASETSQLHQPPIVVFRTSSDPPIFNPGQPLVTASDYLVDPEGTYARSQESLGPVFALPVVDYQSQVYAAFVKAYIAEWKKHQAWTDWLE